MSKIPASWGCKCRVHRFCLLAQTLGQTATQERLRDPLRWFYMSACVCVQLLQSCLTLCDPRDCSLPGSCVHGISSKASILPHSTFRWLGHYIYWYDLVHLAVWFLFVLSVLCFPFSLILPYLKLSGYLCIIFVFNWYYFFLKCLDKILFICFVRVLVILYYFRCCFTVHSIHF